MEEEKKVSEEVEEKLDLDEDLSVPAKDTSEKNKQDRKTNSYYAKLRREKEAKEREEIKRNSFNEGYREAIKTNPFTDEPIKDDYDLEIYFEMKKLEEQGLDPIKGLPGIYANKLREEKEVEKREIESKAKIAKEIETLKKKYPTVDVMELFEKDEDFADFADGKVGNKSMVDIYESYLKFQARHKNVSSKETKATPSASGEEENKPSIKQLSEKDIEKEFNKKFPRFY